MRFSIAAYCEESTTKTEHGRYIWSRTRAELSHDLPCQYGGNDGSNGSYASRQCNDRGVWEGVLYDQCLTYSQAILQRVETVSMIHEIITRPVPEYRNISLH